MTNAMRALVEQWRQFAALWRLDSTVSGLVGGGIAACADELEALLGETCEWKPDEDGVYGTDCGEAFVFIDGSPFENKLRYCCYCGKSLRVGREPQE